MDHVETPHPKAKVLASKETVLLARARGVELEVNQARPARGRLTPGLWAHTRRQGPVHRGRAPLHGRRRREGARVHEQVQDQEGQGPDNGDHFRRPALHLPAARPDGQDGQRDDRAHLRQGEASGAHGLPLGQVADTLFPLLVLAPFLRPRVRRPDERHLQGVGRPAEEGGQDHPADPRGPPAGSLGDGRPYDELAEQGSPRG